MAITGAPDAGREGSVISLGSTASDPAGVNDTLTYAWSVTRDGVTYGSGGSGASYDFTPDDDGVYLVTLIVSDEDGGSTTVSRSITVANVAPVATITAAPQGGFEGTAISLEGSFSDPGSADTHTLAWSVTKDGDPYASGSGLTVSFVPDDDGIYSVTFAVSDNAGAGTADTAVVTVANVDPTATILVRPTFGPEGTAISLSSDLYDPGTLDSHSYLWAVAASNGQVVAGGSGPGFSFIPNDDGTYVVTLTVTDDGGVGTDTKTITIENVAPTAAVTGAPATSPAGTAISLGGAVADAGTGDTHLLTWVVSKDGSLYATGAGPDFSFTPNAGGSYVITLSATDDDGGVGTDTRTIAVASTANVAPAVTAFVGPVSGVRGQTLAFSGAFTDPDPADTWTATIDFGDGSGVQPLALNPDKTFAINHVFVAAGTYTVTVRVVDDGGESDTASWVTTTSVMAVQDDPQNPGSSRLVIGGTTGADSIIVTRGFWPGSYIASVFTPGPDGGGALTIGVFRPAAGGWDIELTACGYTLTAFAASLTGPLGGVEVFAQAGDDDVQVSGSVGLSAWVYAGAGDDRVRGGGGNDVLLGEAGERPTGRRRWPGRDDRRPRC